MANIDLTTYRKDELAERDWMDPCADWPADMAQATHFKTLGAARSKMAGRNAKYRDAARLRLAALQAQYERRPSA